MVHDVGLPRRIIVNAIKNYVRRFILLPCGDVIGAKLLQVNTISQNVQELVSTVTITIL